MTTTLSLVRIGQSDLLDFALKTGLAQQSKVSEVKYRPDYDARTDYWKRLRDRIARMHQKDEPLTVLDELCSLVPDKKKQNYRQAVTVYKRFLRGKRIEWFAPDKGLWGYGDLVVGINPELGLVIDGTPHVIKLYFREEKLSKDRALGVVQLMEATLGKKHPPGTVFSILDVPRTKLVTNIGRKRDLMPLIRAYALAFVQMYNEL